MYTVLIVLSLVYNNVQSFFTVEMSKCNDQALVNAMSQGPVFFSLVIRLVESKGGAKVTGVQL